MAFNYNNQAVAEQIIAELKAKKKADPSAKLVLTFPLEVVENCVLETRLYTQTGKFKAFVTPLDGDGIAVCEASAEKPSAAKKALEDILEKYPLV